MSILSHISKKFQQLVSSAAESEVNRIMHSPEFASTVSKARLVRLGGLGDLEADVFNIADANETADKVSGLVEDYASRHLEQELPNLVERFVEEALDGVSAVLENGEVVRFQMQRSSPQKWAISTSDVLVFNERCKSLLALQDDRMKSSIPAAVVARLCTQPQFSLGWTGWKFDRTREHIGSQFLAALAPHGQGPFIGGRGFEVDGEFVPVKFFYANVCDSPVGRTYETGDDLIPPVYGQEMLTKNRLIELSDRSDADLTEWLMSSWRALLSAVTGHVDGTTPDE